MERAHCFFQPGAFVKDGEPGPEWKFVEEEDRTVQLRRGLEDSSDFDPLSNPQLELIYSEGLH